MTDKDMASPSGGPLMNQAPAGLGHTVSVPDAVEPSIYDLLEAIVDGAPEGSLAWQLRGGFSRNCRGVDMDYLVPKIRGALEGKPASHCMSAAISGIGRDASEPRCLSLYFDRKPTDAEMHCVVSMIQSAKEPTDA